MADLPVPTGEEDPQKYYASPYLDEVDNLKHKVQHTNAVGGSVDVSEEHPLTVAAVAPHLVDGVDSVKSDVSEQMLKHHGNVSEIKDEGQSMPEAHGDTDTRVEAAQTNSSTLEGNDSERNNDSSDRTNDSSDSGSGSETLDESEGKDENTTSSSDEETHFNLSS